MPQIRNLQTNKKKKSMTFKKRGALTWLNLVNGCTLLYLFVAGCTPCSAEELFSFVSLVVSLPAHLTVVPVFVVVTRETLEHFLLRTALGAVNILIALAFFAAFWEGLLCAHTSCNSIANSWVFFSLEAEEGLLDLLRVHVLFITLFNSFDYVWSAVLGVCFR